MAKNSKRSSIPPGHRRATIDLPDELAERIIDVAHAANESRNYLVRWCIEHGLAAFAKAHPKPRRRLLTGPRLKVVK